MLQRVITARSSGRDDVKTVLAKPKALVLSSWISTSGKKQLEFTETKLDVYILIEEILLQQCR